jgi:hypothetical protein
MRAKLLFTVISAVLAGATAATAQTPPAKAPAPFVEPKLAFDREAFTYPGESRRDPFAPSGGDNALGPLFEDLVLRGIIWSPVPRSSLALIHDGGRKVYRLRTGDEIGNARVIAIEKERVRFSVSSFGNVRHEVMTKAPPETVAEIRARQQQEPAAPANNGVGQLQQELLRALQSQRDSTARVSPPVRRDTSTTASRPRN